MAINKTINKRTNTHGAMRNCIEYVLRQDKTSELLTYVTGPYCHDEINYDLVYRAFLEEKKVWDKDSGRMYAHNIISWHKDEQITPEQALEFGKEFAENWFSGFQTLVAVHKDKDHIHCHLVTNSVSYEDGRKLHNTRKDLERMKQLTNQMCRERGLTVAEKGKHFDGSQIEKGEVIAWSKDKYNLFCQQVKDSFVADCAMAVLKALENCISKEMFIEKMKQFGWNVNWTEKRKHITFQNQDGKKVRDSNLSKTFHLDISKEGLENEFDRNRQKDRDSANRDSRADEELRNYYRELDAAIADTRGITNQAQSGEGYSRTEFQESERVHALIGEISKADAILSDVLTLVRKQLVKASGNEYLSSIEESIVSLINFIRQGNIVDETEECIHESDVSWWNENDKYCLYLNTEEKGNKSFETKDNFDLSSTYTMHMGRDNSNVFYALEYLRFLEQTGHPFRLQNVTNTKGLHSTVKLLAPYYPHWCLMQILIAQDNKHIDLMFGRVKLYELSQKEVDDIAKEYLRIFQIVMKNVKPENFFFAKSIYEQSAVVLPDIIARLCYKCSINILDEIFDSILDLCLSNVRTNFKGIRKIFKGLFEAFSLQDQENRIEKILQFPVDVDRMSDYCDPIVFISKPREKYVLDIEIYNRILFQIKQTIKEAENEKRQAAVNRLVILAQVIILNEEDLRYLCKVLEKEETLENKSILYVLDKQKYEKNKKEIFEDTLKRMKSDSNTQMFSAGGNNYRDLIGILNDIDISKINLEEALEVLTNLVKTNQSWVERNQPNASERIRQSFLIVMGLIILRESKNIDLSETEKEKVYAYFEALSELYKNSIAIDMIEACFVDDSKFYFEDFQNKIWLSNEQELGLIKDFYDVLYINDFKLQNNDMLLKCSNMLFRISIYRVISSEILHNMAALKLCYAIIKNEIVLKTEIQTLLVCLLKLQDETVIKQTDSEQEALYKLRCRIISCKIAKELYVRGIKSDIVDGWKRISENKNEFIEIRNVVFDTTGDE